MPRAATRSRRINRAGEREQHVDAAHQERIDQRAAVAGDQADRDPRRVREQGCRARDPDDGEAAVEHAGEDVPAEVVSAEERRPRRRGSGALRSGWQARAAQRAARGSRSRGRRRAGPCRLAEIVCMRRGTRRRAFKHSSSASAPRTMTARSASDVDGDVGRGQDHRRSRRSPECPAARPLGRACGRCPGS